MKKIISVILSIFMLACTLSSFTFVHAEGPEFLCKSGGADVFVDKSTGDVQFYLNGKLLFSEDVPDGTKITDTVAVEDYTSKVFKSPQEKVATTMNYFYDNGEYAIFADKDSGEVAMMTKSTGQILLTNPYDVGATTSDTKIKNQLLSQVILTYQKRGNENTYSSFGEGALNNQVKIKKIRSGVRVEYTIGRSEIRTLVPELIEKGAFEEKILSKVTIENAVSGKTEAAVKKDYSKLTAFYNLKDPNAKGLSDTAKKNMKLTYPITQKYAVYMLDAGTSARQKYEIESIIKEYTDYSFEDMESDYATVEYEGTEASPPLFKIAIEYYADEYGFKVRVPSKSIRYDSAEYTVSNMIILPYLGAGSNDESGYTFIPDGSGVITYFKDAVEKPIVITGKMYGMDYSYHKTSGQNQEVMRLPAFGVARDSSYMLVTKKTAKTNVDQASANQTSDFDYSGVNVSEKTAYLGYVEEGESLIDISTAHGGTVSHKYNSAYTKIYPILKDTYKLSGVNAEMTVDSNRKYTGNYTYRIFPLSDEKANYIGMAEVLRDYLEKTGVISKLDKENGNSDIPLYLENFGSLTTSQKIMGFPVSEQTPLTTFEQSKTMISELKEAGVENINLKLTGWYNGGLSHTVPSKLKVEKALGGEKDLLDLIKYASENKIGIYPDLEFTFVSKTEMFDGYNYKKDAVKTIDKRSAVIQEYSPLYQEFEDGRYQILSPNAISKFYEKSSEKYLKYNAGGISVASLGSYLNSDQNEDYPYTREEAKSEISNILSKMKEDNGSVLVDGGNSYTLKYADHILNMPVDSSRNVYTSEAIPFIGMVLHGYKEYTGTAMNLDGDYKYSILKAVENGASPYFILSYTSDEFDNTSELKNYPEFRKYYSIKYNIWKNDLVETYNTLNDALSNVKYSTISSHEYIDERVVKVTYSNGVSFILNYNDEPYEYNGTTIEKLSFINEKGEDHE